MMARFAVTVTIFVGATDSQEAALIVERLLAGRFDFNLDPANVVSSTETGGAG